MKLTWNSYVMQTPNLKPINPPFHPVPFHLPIVALHVVFDICWKFVFFFYVRPFFTSSFCFFYQISIAPYTNFFARFFIGFYVAFFAIFSYPIFYLPLNYIFCSILFFDFCLPFRIVSFHLSALALFGFFQKKIDLFLKLVVPNSLHS